MENQEVAQKLESILDETFKQNSKVEAFEFLVPEIKNLIAELKE